MSKRLIDAEILAFDIKVKRDWLDTSSVVGRGEYIALNKALVMIDEQPTVDAVEVVHGRWLEEGNSCSYIFHCSVCGGVAYFVHGKGRGRNMERRFCGYRYCPNCGAVMKGAER